MSKLIADKFNEWENECNNRFNTLKANEEELNKIFIDIYGLQDELTPEVEDKDVTVRKADLTREIKSLISYGVGCMFGRYSLDEEGLVYAGGDFDLPRYKTCIPTEDNVLLITDDDYTTDDITTRFIEFVKVVYGEETLQENLEFIASVLSGKGSPKEKLRRYFLKDFYKDHIKIYQKRPIYWLYDAGKSDGFKALIYMHRYNLDTTGRVRVDYLHQLQRVYYREMERMQENVDNNFEVAKSQKRLEKLAKQLKEAKDYDEKIAYLALARIEIDLDDGVKVNYQKVQTSPDGKVFNILGKI
ncbi:hypothetical protein AN639_02600 [Candidatus Epulonipiscium fishelsonii]|uniref:Uncharacterized protein n=1 Tax=Candidatus Epulonipiscium fishelsonii TaxID=77094 RepID=A0ACC8XA46_9FIRM|nr:hypothetical protein AN396_09485 [Epulopiscium sp. SCG-B11WGA-EpuloA1]ONI42016.1 hypothetical protein AN639_02600 [Epulopiscium sp. SCG-B05WGA-EpuloA1]